MADELDEELLPQRFETVQLPETAAEAENDDPAITVGPPVPDEDERTDFTDSSDMLAVRYEAPFSDIVLKQGSYGRADDVRLRDLDLMEDCILCKMNGKRVDCPLCYGTGDVPKATYFRMFDAYLVGTAAEQEAIARHPTVVAGASAPPPAIAPVGALANLRNALSISYLHSRYQLQFASCDIDPEWRVYVRWRIGKPRYYLYLQPCEWRGTIQRLAPIYRSDELGKIERMLRYFLLGGLDLEAEIWRPLL